MGQDAVTITHKPRTWLGVEAENTGLPALDPGRIEIARAIEAAGADSVAVSGHLLAVAPPSRADERGADAI